MRIGVVGLGAAGVLVGAVALGAGAGVAQASPGVGGVVTVAGVRPGWAAPQDATGVPTASSSVTTRVFLAGADPRGLAAYATAVSTPGDAGYRHFLSSAEAAAQYAPTAGEQQAVASWLTQSGLRVTAANDQYVQVTGSVGDVDRAYGVVLRP
jgi:hypothetical protein